MKGKVEESGFLAVGLLGLMPVLGLKLDDFSAVLGIVVWILIGLVLVKVLAIFAGVS